MSRLLNNIKYFLRLIPMIISGTYFSFRLLPEKTKDELVDITMNPKLWGESIEKAWDVSIISADHFKDTSLTLANLSIGRKVSKKDKIRATNDLAALSIIVPPLRIFMIPGSYIILGILSKVTPWRLIPDEWIPINALKKIREGITEDEIETETRGMRRLFRRNKN